MSLHNSFLGVLHDYQRYKEQQPGVNQESSVYIEIQKNIPFYIQNTLQRGDFLITGSVGAGRWAEVPWIGIFNRNITSSAQQGFYVCYLFANDMNSIFLTIIHSITKKVSGKSWGKDQIKSFVDSKRQNLKTYIENNQYHLPEDIIIDDPLSFGKSERAKKYSESTIAYKEYKKGNIPSNDELIKDLYKFIDLYDLMAKAEGYFIKNEGDDMAYSSETGNVNVDILHNELKLNRKGAEVVFQNDELFVISPSIQNGANWFDIRKLNLDRFKTSNKKGFLILRHEQHFLVADLHDFALQLMKENYLRNSKTGGEHWKFNIESLDKQYFVYNQGNRNLFYIMKYADKQTLKGDIEKLTKKITPYQFNNEEDFNDEENEEVTNLVFTKLDDKEVLEHIHSYLTSRGFLYSKENIANLYLSLRSKPFVIISGISGTGKTKIVQLFAESVGATEDNKQFKLIAVRPDWSDSSDLLGYKNLQDQFVEGQLTEIVKRAHEHPTLPHFVVLDEMNLARVEYYLSEFLSIVESRRVGEDGQVVSSPLVTTNDGAFSLPNNLYIIGTVNMDETTHPFSKKVLDRANTIEFNEIQLANFAMFEESGEEVAAVRVGNGQFESKYLYLKQAYGHNKELIHKVSERLEEINNQLQTIYAQVGYRVRDEICFYMLYNDDMKLLSEDEAFDFCMMQKILSRISGTGSTVQNLLMNLYKKFAGEVYDREKAVPASARYPRSAKKVAEMLNRLYTDGFTSFWVS